MSEQDRLKEYLRYDNEDPRIRVAVESLRPWSNKVEIDLAECEHTARFNKQGETAIGYLKSRVENRIEQDDTVRLRMRDKIDYVIRNEGVPLSVLRELAKICDEWEYENYEGDWHPFHIAEVKKAVPNHFGDESRELETGVCRNCDPDITGRT